MLTAGCVTQPQPAPEAAGSAPPPPAAAGTSTTTQPSSASSSLLSVIATPFLIAIKIPTCILTLGMAAPLAGISEIAGQNAGTRDMKKQLSYGVDQNCGPPWAVSP
jgi:hypothetical protein